MTRQSQPQPPRRLRCAIYTRKSSEEGPENRANVLVLELNRTAVAVDLGLEIAIARGFDIGLASKVR